MRRLLLALPVAFAPVFAATPAAADTEYWGWFETRIPIAQPVSLRVLSDARFWDEGLVELNGAGGQNRAEGGVGYQLTDALRFDVGTMIRSRSATWATFDHDLVFNTYLYFAPAL